VKEIQPLTEYLGLMVCFDPKTLSRMQPTKAFLQCLNELVVGCHSTTVVPPESRGIRKDTFIGSGTTGKAKSRRNDFEMGKTVTPAAIARHL
jgi:hypothetical protein